MVAPSVKARQAKHNAVGQGRPTTKENLALRGELLLEIPKPPQDLNSEKSEWFWNEVCQILVQRKILKTAHFFDLVNYCNSQSQICQLDEQLKDINKLPTKNLKDQAQKLSLQERVIKLRKGLIDITLTIGSRFGLDALSEKRFSDNVAQANKSEKSNPFSAIEL